jgi:glycerol-3-phosphate dehydrogenase
VFAGIRPLVRDGDSTNTAALSRGTAALSRGHTIRIENSGLVTVCGGKWTTYRNMAEDCVNHAATFGRLPDRPCVTAHLDIHGSHPDAASLGQFAEYGSDAPWLQALMKTDPSLSDPLHDALPYSAAEVLWAVREEMARTVEDVLARRTRALFLNARAAIAMAPRVAALMARELDRDCGWEADQIQAFERTASGFLLETESS